MRKIDLLSKQSYNQGHLLSANPKRDQPNSRDVNDNTLSWNTLTFILQLDIRKRWAVEYQNQENQENNI